ncbi:hypothetical protein [Citreimonas sp.]|uniref:hypothetical protein n=1 Tax=Citreimonas sp. TaxID=3036715 RepID=UPI0035C7F016
MLRSDLGPFGAEDIVCRAMEDISQRLFHIQRLAIDGPPEDLHKALRALCPVAEQIGLKSMAQVSRDVMLCIEDADPVAVAATLSRLTRIAEQSLVRLWNSPELSV